MAETFLEALARLRGGQAAGATPLPTGYSQIQVPQGTLRDADTRTTPTGSCAPCGARSICARHDPRGQTWASCGGPRRR
jgi:hypothetical protein